MPPKNPAASGARELFRYARVFPPRIVDLTHRFSTYPETKPPEGEASDERSSESERTAWAQQFVQSAEYVADPVSLLPKELLELLTIDRVPDDRLPSRRQIKDVASFDAAVKAHKGSLDELKRKVVLSLAASARAGRADAVAGLTRGLQVIELLPHLSKTDKRLPYAPPVLNRDRKTKTKKAELQLPEAKSEAARVDAEPRASSRDVLAMWSLANEYASRKRRALDEEIEAIKRPSFTPSGERAAPRRRKGTKAKVDRERGKEYRAYLSSKTEALKQLNAEIRRLAHAPAWERLELMKSDAGFREHVEKTYPDGASPRHARMASGAMYTPSFADMYSGTKLEESGLTEGAKRCVYESGNPCVEELAKDVPAVGNGEDVRPLGLAELVTVEERWLSYVPGEISAIENILKGEFRRKKVKSTKIFEELTERITQEVQEREAETASTVKQDLSSHIESELASRFASSINASASGSGGGTIGVVNLEGGASLGAGVQLGIDTTLSSSTESEFSQEIVSKAVERAKKTTSELRRTRAYQRFVTTNLHEIDNTANGAAHTNAIYCFLDKNICIAERVYGLRKFLTAELIRPGSELIKKEGQKHLLNLNEIGLPPTFDLTPNDISPANYLELVGGLRASNVSPPPSPVKIVSKTYKTDVTNENREPNEIDAQKIADILTPFFGEYKRFLIQDNIDIPDGYAVQEVRVTVTHGSNGLSIPAHLPLSLLGSSIYALPTLGIASVPPYTLFYLPLAIWQVLYTASPLLHYNADSSNVTINIGHETAESPYYFFQPDFLIREFLDALGNSFVVTEDFVEFIRARLQALYTAFTSTSNNGVLNAVEGVTDAMRGEINRFIGDLQTYLGTLVTSIIPALITGGTASGPVLPTVPSIDPNLLMAIPREVLAPFREFFESVMTHIEELMADSIGNLFEFLTTMMQNTDTRVFVGAKGETESLPIYFNCV
jgi:hypothetical protein